MGNEQSGGPDAGGDEDAASAAVPSAPSTPKPILRNPGNAGVQLGDEKNRRSVVFRDQTEDALRLNHSIVKSAAIGGQSAASSGLTRISQQVNDISNGGQWRAGEAANGQVRRAVRMQKPPAPAPPQPLQSSQRPTAGQETVVVRNSAKDETPEAKADDKASRMRDYVFALAEKKQPRRDANGSAESAGGRLYDPSVQELPTVLEEKEERSDRGSMARADSTEALKEEIKQEILKDLLHHPQPTAHQQQRPMELQTELPADKTSSKMNDIEKRRLIAEIRQQLLGEATPVASLDYADASMPEPDYSEDELPPLSTEQQQQQRQQLARFASEIELRQAAAMPNGRYRVQPQPRRYKGPAPAPPGARYRRSGGPPVVREPYQAQWEEPIFAYDAAEPEAQEQRLQEQMEKEYDDRYRQKHRSKRFGDSWKRMTASLSKAFGLGSGGGSGGAGSSGGASGNGSGGAKSGVSRRSSVRDSTFDRPSMPAADYSRQPSQQQHQRQHQRQQIGPHFSNNKPVSSVELPRSESPGPQNQQQQQQLNYPQKQPGARAPLTDDIWRDVAQASHKQMLHTSNPMFGYKHSAAEAPVAGNSTVAKAKAAPAPESTSKRSSDARAASAPQASARTQGEQTYL